MEQKLALKGRNYIDKANTKQMNFFISNRGKETIKL